MARIPMYRLIEDDLAAQIATGELDVEAKLPSEHELAERYGVSRMTVRQALDRLESVHLIVRHQGSGNFVSPLQVRGRRLTHLTSFTDDLMGVNRKVDTVVIKLEIVPAPGAVADGLHLKPAQAVNHFERLRTVDGVPAALQESWVPYAVAPGLTREGMIDGSLYRTLRHRYGIQLQWADQIITAVQLTTYQSELLEAASGSAALSTRRTAFGRNGQAVEFADSWTLPQFPLYTRIDA